jgi:4-alpha-glucanotransferase
MNVQFRIHYVTQPGQALVLTVNRYRAEGQTEVDTHEMTHLGEGHWMLEIPAEGGERLEYRYWVYRQGTAEREEWGAAHSARLPADAHPCLLHDFWQDKPNMAFLYTAPYTDSLLRHADEPTPPKPQPGQVVLKVHAPFVRKHQCVGISGDTGLFGGWKIDKALRMHREQPHEWVATLNADDLPISCSYKFVLMDTDSSRIEHYEWGEPRVLHTPQNLDDAFVQYAGATFRFQEAPWKGAGVALPIFSLRSESSWGCGDFGDLNRLTDWAVAAGMQLIQTLPVNDTTWTETWEDSYPYNAVSSLALHPIYCCIGALPKLNDPQQMKAFEQRRHGLNLLGEMDYEGVFQLKWEYLRALFAEKGEAQTSSETYRSFVQRNEDWLLPYAVFCYLRQHTGSLDFAQWGKWSTYRKEGVAALMQPSSGSHAEIQLHCWVQFLLDEQLQAAKAYAHAHGVVLKGDIPIGISRHSVEAWSKPHLFNKEAQVGAPPDDFSTTGQNWGFPSYDWEHMAADGYQWWKQRLQKMADYFDAYRIDHILGFFRIWEIPLHAVEGLLGHFHPALPLRPEEMRDFGFDFDPDMLTPRIGTKVLKEWFGESASTVTETYLKKAHGKPGFWELKSAFRTQRQIKAQVEASEQGPQADSLLKGLYRLCADVLFVEDPHEPGCFHPRITGRSTEAYGRLDPVQQAAYGRLYDHFYFERNESLWKEKAYERLPVLLGATRMLACGEDLGMIPNCVPEVMHALDILSLEIQRMPKTYGQRFENLNTLPYLSVCTTSTHDTTPLRAWWLEDRERVQQYYQQVLWKSGEAPWECTPEIARAIVANHLAAPSMWVILPLQDWLALSPKMRNPDPLSERINIPNNPRHYWRYRMHLTLEELLQAKAFNGGLREGISQSGRY